MVKSTHKLVTPIVKTHLQGYEVSGSGICPSFILLGIFLPGTFRSAGSFFSLKCPEAEFMNVQNFVEVSGHNLVNFMIGGFRIQCLHYKPLSNHFRWGGGGGCKIRQ